MTAAHAGLASLSRQVLMGVQAIRVLELGEVCAKKERRTIANLLSGIIEDESLKEPDDSFHLRTHYGLIFSASRTSTM